jgi:hypothetical protein
VEQAIERTGKEKIPFASRAGPHVKEKEAEGHSADPAGGATRGCDRGHVKVAAKETGALEKLGGELTARLSLGSRKRLLSTPAQLRRSIIECWMTYAQMIFSPYQQTIKLAPHGQKFNSIPFQS